MGDWGWRFEGAKTPWLDFRRNCRRGEWKKRRGEGGKGKKEEGEEEREKMKAVVKVYGPKGTPFTRLQFMDESVPHLRVFRL